MNNLFRKSEYPIPSIILQNYKIIQKRRLKIARYKRKEKIQGSNYKIRKITPTGKYQGRRKPDGQMNSNVTIMI